MSSSVNSFCCAAAAWPKRAAATSRMIPRRMRAIVRWLPMRKYRLERVDDAAVVQVYADGFASLPADQKQLIWHLYRAAIAGRDIFYDQRYAHNLDMRDVLEAIVSRPALSAADPDGFREVERYTKLFWINTGPYNNLTARKLMLK